MKAYRDSSGVFHRTQAEARGSGLEWELVQVPTAQAELIAFLNALRDEYSADEFMERVRESVQQPYDGEQLVVVPERRLARDKTYKNGDPTRKFMGSRNPDAIFTCTECGFNNRNQFDD